METFKRDVNMKSEDGQELAIQMIKPLADEVFQALDEDGEGKLDWKEFKGYGKINKERQDEIRDHIRYKIE